MPTKGNRFSRLILEVKCAICGSAVDVVEVPESASASGAESFKDVKEHCYHCPLCGHTTKVVLPDTAVSLRAEEKQPKEQ